MTRHVRMEEAAVCYRRDDHGEQVPGAPGQGGGPREVQGAKGRRGADQGQLRHSGPIQTTLRGQEVIKKGLNPASAELLPQLSGTTPPRRCSYTLPRSGGDTTTAVSTSGQFYVALRFYAHRLIMCRVHLLNFL